MPPIRRVLVLAVEGTESLDILGPVEVFDYADRVRSLSQGRAAASMEPKAYREVPEDIFKKLTNPDGFDW